MTAREETAEIQALAHREDGLREDGPGLEVFAFLGNLFLATEGCQMLLKGRRKGDNRVTRGVGFDPLGDVFEVLVLLADKVTLAEVDEVDDWLCCQEEKGIDDFNLFRPLKVQGC